MENQDIVKNQELAIEDWMKEEQHQDWVEMMQESAVIPFATALWA